MVRLHGRPALASKRGGDRTRASHFYGTIPALGNAATYALLPITQILVPSTNSSSSPPAARRVPSTARKRRHDLSALPGRASLAGDPLFMRLPASNEPPHPAALRPWTPHPTVHLPHCPPVPARPSILEGCHLSSSPPGKARLPAKSTSPRPNFLLHYSCRSCLPRRPKRPGWIGTGDPASSLSLRASRQSNPTSPVSQPR